MKLSLAKIDSLELKKLSREIYLSANSPAHNRTEADVHAFIQDTAISIIQQYQLNHSQREHDIYVEGVLNSAGAINDKQ